MIFSSLSHLPPVCPTGHVHVIYKYTLTLFNAYTYTHTTDSSLPCFFDRLLAHAYKFALRDNAHPSDSSKCLRVQSTYTYFASITFFLFYSLSLICYPLFALSLSHFLLFIRCLVSDRFVDSPSYSLSIFFFFFYYGLSLFRFLSYTAAGKSPDHAL